MCIKVVDKFYFLSNDFDALRITWIKFRCLIHTPCVWIMPRVWGLAHKALHSFTPSFSYKLIFVGFFPLPDVLTFPCFAKFQGPFCMRCLSISSFLYLECHLPFILPHWQIDTNQRLKGTGNSFWNKVLKDSVCVCVFIFWTDRRKKRKEGRKV